MQNTHVQGTVVCVSTLCPEEAETGEFLELAGQPVQLNW